MRATKAVVSLQSIRHNVNELRKLAPAAELMAVIKADGYGHGATQVALAAMSAGARWLCVATLEEGLSLRQDGIRAPILVMGVLSAADCAQCVLYDMAACVFLPEQLAAMQQAALQSGKIAQAHLKVDTGFHRIGVFGPELERMLAAFGRHDSVIMQGIFTHFATADMADDSFVFEQLERFETAMQSVHDAGYRPKVHVSNSAALIRHGKLAGDMVRMGIAMYGCVPSLEMSMPFEPRQAMKWVSEIGAISRIEGGETVGYGRTFKADIASVIATIPVGYADGYARCLGGRAVVLIQGKRCPVIGRVCMDQIMVDVSGLDEPALHDEVVLMGDQGSDCIRAGEIAKWMGSIDYEVLVSISKRVPREYTNDG